MDMSLSQLQEIVKDRKAWCAAIHGSQSRTRLSDWTDLWFIIHIVIHNKKWIFGFCSCFLSKSSKNSWNFPNNESCKDVSIMSVRWLLESTWGWGLVLRRISHVIKGLKFLAPHPDLLGGERDWRLKGYPITNDLINHAYVIKPPWKAKESVWRASGLVNTWTAREIDTFRESMDTPCPFSIPCPKHLFHLAVPELYPFIINQWSSK